MLTGAARGAAFICVAMLLFTVMSGMVKATAPDIPPGQAVFARSVFAIPVILGWLLARGDFPGGLSTNRWQGHAVRGVAGTLAMGLGFAGLAYLPLPEVTAIRFITPILLVVLAALILGERFRLVRLGAVCLGLVGVSIIAWPRLGGGLGDAATLGVALTLASAGLAALAQVFVKGMSGTESTSAIVFWFSVTSGTLSLATLPFGWVWPTPGQAALLVGAGLLGGLGQICLTSSYRFADAGALAPFTYTSMVWALIVGWIWFAEVPTWQMLGGALLVIAAGSIIVWRERQLGRDATARRKVRAKGLQ
ncbi:MAG: DMT family transporter [Shimia sp.]